MHGSWAGLPAPGERFIVDTDASNVGIGVVVSQVQDGYSLLQYHPVQGREELMCNTSGVVGHRENTGTFSQLPVWAITCASTTPP